MLAYEATIEIDAPPEAVWRVLADVWNYPKWNSGITRVEGTAAEKAKLTICTEVRPDKELTVSVTELTDDDRMVWEYGLPFRLFRAGRAFNITLIDGDRTYFQTRQVFAGRLLPLFKAKIPDLEPSLQQFARGLKFEVERQALHTPLSDTETRVPNATQ